MPRYKMLEVVLFKLLQFLNVAFLVGIFESTEKNNLKLKLELKYDNADDVS